jgi:hypothetical protein
MERPILFSGPMVNAILEGRKTQTRRIVKPQPDENGLSFMRYAPLDWRDDVNGEWNQWKGETPNGDSWRGRVQCWPGDRLWVREQHRFTRDAKHDYIEFRSDGQVGIVQDNSEWLRDEDFERWKPSIHMPRWASRITLEVVSVRVERLNDISEDDAKTEGVALADCCLTYFHGYSKLWESINGPGSWEANPWVWVITFKVVDVACTVKV